MHLKYSTASVLKLWVFANTILWPISVTFASLNLGLNVIILSFALTIWLLLRNRIDKHSIYSTIIIASFFFFSALITYFGPCTDKFDKLIFTAPVLLLFIFLGIAIGRATKAEDWRDLDGTAIWAIGIAFSGFIFEMIFPGLFPNQEKYRIHMSYSGIYPEPSAVAFGLFPAIAILLSSSQKRARNIGMLVLVILLLISQSSTLIVATATWILYQYIFYARRLGVKYTVLILAIVSIAVFMSIDKYATSLLDRITGIFASDSTQNLSSLVYLQGLEDAIENFTRTNGLGLGINMMGCSPLPDVPARQVISMSIGVNLNSEDGSLILSKIVSETGAIGIAFYLITSFIWFRSELLTKGTCNANLLHAHRIQMAFVFLFLVFSVVRSTGYFSGSFLLLVPALIASLRIKK